MTEIKPEDAAAFDAAYNALIPYTQNAQVRAEIAALVVKTLREYHVYASVEVLPNRLVPWTRVNRTALTDVVLATRAAMDRG